MADPSSAGLLGQTNLQVEVDPWEIAKMRFLNDLDEEEKALFNEATLENLYYSASNTEQKDQENSRIRSTLRTLQPLISALEDYGKAIDTFSSTASLYLAPIWGSIRVVLLMASTHDKFYSRIADTFGRIGDVLPRFRDYQRIFDGKKHPRFTQALSAAYLDIITLCIEFRTLLRGQGKSTIRRLFKPLLPSLNAQLDEAVDRFRKRRKAVEQEADLCHMIEEKEARELVLRNHEAAESREREAKQKSLISQLSSIDYEYKHRRMQRIRHDGTGSWFPALPEFRKWVGAEAPSVLCCYGIPGCGKSVLTSSLIDSFLSLPDSLKLSSSATVNIAYHYCNHADKRTLEPVLIFSTIVKQLLTRMNTIPNTMSEMIEKALYTGRAGNSDLEAIHQLLEAITMQISSVTIFIDGLDEVVEDNRNLIFLYLRRLLIQLPSYSIRLFISSREDTTYLTQGSSIQNYKIHITSTTIAPDIEGYVRHAVEGLIKSRDLVIRDSNLHDEICTTLASGAKGMFLWVKFQLDELCATDTDNGIRRVLQNLPKDLGETYARLLGRIDGAERHEYVHRMLYWIMFSRRPLHVEELREAIAFTIEHRYWDAAEIPNDLIRLIRACGNLVFIDEESQNVHLAHYTVQQYLLDPQRPKPAPFNTTPEEADRKLGQVCIAYLNFTDFETQLTKTVDITTQNLAAFERVVASQPLVPMGNVGTAVAKLLFTARDRTQRPSKIEFARHFPKRPIPSKTLEKYCLLSYVTENWLWHTLTITTDSGSSAFERQGFNQLVLEKVLPFDIRPWDTIAMSRDASRYRGLMSIGWAVSANHVPLLQVLEHLISIHLEDLATTSWRSMRKLDIVYPFSSLPDHLTDKVKERACDTLRTKNEWLSWLYHQLIAASNNGHLEILKLIFTSWKGTLQSEDNWHVSPRDFVLSHLILQATIHNHTVMVKYLCEESCRSGGIIWMSTGHKVLGFPCNALEHAVVQSDEDTVVILARNGCFTSTSFKFHAWEGLIVQNAIEAGRTTVVRCLLDFITVHPRLGRDQEQEIQELRLALKLNPNLWQLHHNSDTMESGVDADSSLYPLKVRAIVTAASKGYQEVLIELLSGRVSVVEDEETFGGDILVSLLTAIYCGQTRLVELLVSTDAGKSRAQCLISDIVSLLNSRSIDMYEASGHATDPLQYNSSQEIQVQDLGTLSYTLQVAQNFINPPANIASLVIDAMLDAHVEPSYKTGRWLLKDAIALDLQDRAVKLFRGSGKGRYNHFLGMQGLSIISKRSAVQDLFEFTFVSPLCWAILHARKAIVESFLSLGASLEEVADSYLEYTAMHYAVMVGSLDLLKLLLEHEAKLKAYNHLGQTLIEVAALCKDGQCRLDMIHFIISLIAQQNKAAKVIADLVTTEEQEELAKKVENAHAQKVGDDVGKRETALTIRGFSKAHAVRLTSLSEDLEEKISISEASEGKDAKDNESTRAQFSEGSNDEVESQTDGMAITIPSSNSSEEEVENNIL